MVVISLQFPWILKLLFGKSAVHLEHAFHKAAVQKLEGVGVELAPARELRHVDLVVMSVGLKHRGPGSQPPPGIAIAGEMHREKILSARKKISFA